MDDERWTMVIRGLSPVVRRSLHTRLERLVRGQLIGNLIDQVNIIQDELPDFKFLEFVHDGRWTMEER